MSTVPLPPGRTFYLRIFVISIVLIVSVLLLLLFAVSMEASVSASGTISSLSKVTLRAPQSGLVESGWYEGKVLDSPEAELRYRVDRQGNGLTNPSSGGGKKIHLWRLEGGELLPAQNKKKDFKWQSLQAGELVWAGQDLVVITPPQGEVKPKNQTPSGKQGLENQGVPQGSAIRVGVPKKYPLWQVLKVKVEPGQFVQAGDPLVTLIPVDDKTHQPLDLVADLYIEERYSDEISRGQDVRLYSAMYNRRLYGRAEGELTRIDPGAEIREGKRYFHTQAVISKSPFPLRIGTSVEAKIILGRKQIYRLILEH